MSWQTVSVLAAAVALSAPAHAQGGVAQVTAGHVQAWAGPKGIALLVDARSPSEYREAHLPGAINLPPERVRAEAARLPADRSAPVIFYCRGPG
jgi:rhodanese-related sulfurtransferase